MRTNERIRRRFARRISPDTRIESVVSLHAAGWAHGSSRAIAARYQRRHGLTNALAPRKYRNHWCVVTENRVLLFAKPQTVLWSTRGPLEHALDRLDVSLRWADFDEGPGLRHRLVHLSTGDLRMLIAQTLLGVNISDETMHDEADLMVQAFGDRAALADLALLD